MKAIKLHCPPGGMFHFGRIAHDVDTSLNDSSPFMHSDSLSSAIVATGFRMLDAAPANFLLEAFQSEAAKVSSLFYCLEIGDRTIYFLPKPVSAECFDLEGEDIEPKDVRSVLFVSQKVYEEGITPPNWKKECHFLGRNFLIKKEEIEGISEEAFKNLKLFDTISLPKVAVHKPTKEASMYFQTNIQIPDFRVFGELKGLGLKVNFYFLLETADEKTERLVFNMMKLIADSGIGGERSVGCGSLDSIDEPISFQLSPTARSEEYLMSSSLVSPKTADDFEKFKDWKMITRGGRKTANHGSLRRVKMLSEGSLTRSGVLGNAQDLFDPSFKLKPGVTPQPFYRFGNALCLPVHQNYLTNE